MSDELWAGASEDHENMTRQAALALADAELEAVMPFLLASRSPAEFAHRSAIAQEPVRAIADRCGLEESDLMAVARRRYELCRQALQEGQDPLAEVVRDSQGGGYGSGPEKPDEHDEGPDFSHGYSEVPAGPPGGPNPQVVQVRPEAPGPVQEATGSRKQADAGSMMTPSYAQPAAPGTGAASSMPSSSVAGMTPGAPASGPAGENTPVMSPETSQVTSSRDPVRRRVMAVTAAIHETNPHLPDAECERVARQVVGRYLQADLAGSVMNDEPVESGEHGGGEGGGHPGGGMAEHMLEGQGLRSMLPGGGAGAAGLMGDAAELAVL